MMRRQGSKCVVRAHVAPRVGSMNISLKCNIINTGPI